MDSYHDDERDALRKYTSYAELKAFLHDRSQKEPGSFEAYEQQLAERIRAFECEIKAAELKRHDVDARVIVVNGQQYNKCLEEEPKTYASASGPLTVARNLFRPSGGGKSVCPMELRAGIVGGFFTPVVARQVAFLMGHLTSEATAEAFRQFGVQGPSSSSCDRLPKVISEVWERNRELWESALRQQETVAVEAVVLAASLDGVMVPDKQAQREAKREREAKKKDLSKPSGGPAGYREVGCGTVSLFDSEGKRLDTIRYGRAPEYKKKTLTEQLDAEVASIVAVRPGLRLVALADGAEENWRYFSSPQWDDATKIVDIGHGCDHLKAAMSARYGAKSVRGRAEYEKYKTILKEEYDGVDVVIAELRRLERGLRGARNKKRRDAVKRERKFFQNQRERMAYAHYKELGLPIGSGIVEAACKTLGTQRLKRSGMSWNDGKQPILTIRSLQQSDRWDRGWELIAREFRRTPARINNIYHFDSASLENDMAA